MGYGWRGKVWWCQGLSHEEGGGGVRWHVHSRVVYLLHSIAQCLHPFPHDGASTVLVALIEASRRSARDVLAWTAVQSWAPSALTRRMDQRFTTDASATAPWRAPTAKRVVELPASTQVKRQRSSNQAPDLPTPPSMVGPFPQRV